MYDTYLDNVGWLHKIACSLTFWLVLPVLSTSVIYEPKQALRPTAESAVRPQTRHLQAVVQCTRTYTRSGISKLPFPEVAGIACNCRWERLCFCWQLLRPVAHVKYTFSQNSKTVKPQNKTNLIRQTHSIVNTRIPNFASVKQFLQNWQNSSATQT